MRFATTIFQSTHPQGVRREVRWLDATTLCIISIHVPTRGATSRSDASVISPSIFQSTHPQGVRPAALIPVPDLFTFQSTHPQGVRPQRHRRYHADMGISIHAPTRGATSTQVSPSPARQNFNPLTHKGCDL